MKPSNLKKYTPKVKKVVTLIFMLISTFANAQSDSESVLFPLKNFGIILLLLLTTFLTLLITLYNYVEINNYVKNYFQKKKQNIDQKTSQILTALNQNQLEILKKSIKKIPVNSILIFISGFLLSQNSYSQSNTAPASRDNLFSQPGVLITLFLIAIPLILSVGIALKVVLRILMKRANKEMENEAEIIAANIMNSTTELDDQKIAYLESQTNYQLDDNELSGNQAASDSKGLIKNLKLHGDFSFFAQKRQPTKRPKIDERLSKLVIWYLISAVVWLLVGTLIGEYVGIKFVAPDADTYSWLSIGRLRAVHTNLVFWAWGTIGIMGLGYYIVPLVSNTALNSIRNGWIALAFMNSSMFLGMVTLMAGINNGGGEYREIIWPIMGVWMLGLVLTVVNFIKTIAKRTTHEIYISNWFIVASYIFILIVAVIAYLPLGQDGIGETIVQGYYMHQAVGMWFMFSMLGVLYYLLPQQLNKPIYSYSLGVLAFWSQILFYTVIGTHHFVFSALPWWLQTVAIIGSVGMLIPVTSGTINYLMTMRGSWSKISNSYSLPFFLVGVVYYFTGSFQGTAEAFRATNLIWHFTDFTIAHSHITMYGIISFLLFGSIYAILPRLTGNEPPQLGVGAHFWMALVGLQFYTIPLMIGGTLKGLMWAEGQPFIDSVVLMGPYWLWRAIGGSLMLFSHFALAFNIYKMMSKNFESDLKDSVFQILEQKNASSLNSNS